MAQQDQRLEQLRNQYLLACAHLRAGSLTKDEFNITLLQVLEGLILQYDDFLPYIYQFREQYRKEVIEAEKRNYLKQL